MSKKLRWFRFYHIYKEAFKELSGRNCKKLIIAMCDYAEYGVTPVIANHKVKEAFNSFKSLYDMDMDIYKEFGKKGAKKRWNNQKK